MEREQGRRGLQVLGAAAALYLLGFLLFYPTVPTVRDSVRYLEQAYAYSQGFSCYEQSHVVTGEVSCSLPARYLPGTAAVMAPFVYAFGWRGGYLVPALSLVLALAFTGLWLRDRGRSPLFALMVIGYPSALVFGRIAMSDMASTALAALGLWLFWGRGEDVRRGFLAGLVAGISMIFREPNVLVFVALFAGTVFRREKAIWALIAGGLVGVAFRPLGTWLAFGDPFFTFPAGPTFALSHIPENLPIYSLCLLVFLPGGAIGALLYKGERRPEIVLTVALFASLYLGYGYTAAESGFAKQLLLAPRYFMPLSPLIAFACAESFPRGVAWLESRFSAAGRSRLRQASSLGVRLWVAGILASAFLVHPAYSFYNAPYREVQEAIYEHSADGSLIVYNSRGIRKFVNRLFGEREFARRKLLDDADIITLLDKYGEFTMVFLDRSGGQVHQNEHVLNREFEERTKALADVELLQETPVSTGDNLRIWHVTRRDKP